MFGRLVYLLYAPLRPPHIVSSSALPKSLRAPTNGWRIILWRRFVASSPCWDALGLDATLKQTQRVGSKGQLATFADGSVRHHTHNVQRVERIYKSTSKVLTLRNSGRKSSGGTMCFAVPQRFKRTNELTRGGAQPGDLLSPGVAGAVREFRRPGQRNKGGSGKQDSFVRALETLPLQLQCPRVLLARRRLRKRPASRDVQGPSYGPGGMRLHSSLPVEESLDRCDFLFSPLDDPPSLLRDREKPHCQASRGDLELRFPAVVALHWRCESEGELRSFTASQRKIGLRRSWDCYSASHCQ